MGKKIIISAVILVLVGLAFFKFSKKMEQKTTPSAANSASQNDPPAGGPKIVSTKPDPLEDTILSSTEPIEITFNRPIQNTGEFKLRIEPKIDFKIELSSDRKTAIISFPKPLELGVTYTLFIGTDTKFDGVGEWGQEKIYHFRTVKYSGV